MEHYDIFIRYSRHDLENVKEVMAGIEQSTTARCWMYLDGIESGTGNRIPLWMFVLKK